MNSTQREECSTGRTTTVPTVIVVDDEPDFRAILQTRLGAEGWRVLQAGDVAGLYELLEENEPDVLILDHSLPGVTGVDAAKVLLRNDFNGADRDLLGVPVAGAQADLPRARPPPGRQDRMEELVVTCYELLETRARSAPLGAGADGQSDCLDGHRSRTACATYGSCRKLSAFEHVWSK